MLKNKNAYAVKTDRGPSLLRPKYHYKNYQKLTKNFSKNTFL